MGHLSIRCDYCGMKWDVYRNRDEKHGHKCPHCGQAVRSETMNQAFKALQAMEDVNLSALTDHVNDHTTLFMFDFVADHIFEGRKELTT